ncbi:protein phosphatase 2C domain-containing protein [Streptomyces sp. WMMC500]|uniref:protein phosphatase 2C domain-containing protein n=1 Tax=Streptomyces sp. WMMC500 TaxID=3015154 RepID=UPI00248A9C00|nr:protein phosphatase 2C domain-containing protein [Streptomyces sp. WMMC500]WBB59282.1 protein phosphatase 2C domain-containing protein [Streptomyces sp. WMMC500]
MANTPPVSELSACPSCEEPLEAGDLFCGACGADLAAPAPAPAAPVPAAAEPVASPNGAAPAAAPAGAPDSRSAEAQRTGSYRIAGPGAGPQGGGDSGEFLLDAPEEDPEHYRIAEPLASPQGADPRAALGTAGPEAAEAAEPPAAGPVPPGRRCIACRTGAIDTDGYCERCGHAQPRERDHMEHEVEGVAAVSDRGLRHHRNEDFFAIAETALPNGAPATVAVVCDGVSSASRPDEASAAASVAAGASLQATLGRGLHPQQAMHEALLAAAGSVNELAAQHSPLSHQNAPACTIVSAVIAGGILTVGWVGDSRAYWVPDDRAAPSARLTEDDSWAAQMVAAGLMSEADAYADERAHAITGWLGADSHELDPHTASFKPDGPGVVIVCTDGLWNYAEAAAELAATVPPDAATRPLHAAQVLVGHALDGGGHDNVTVAVLPFPGPAGGAGPS